MSLPIFTNLSELIKTRPKTLNLYLKLTENYVFDP